MSGEDLSAFDFVEISNPKNISVKDPLSEHSLDIKPRIRGSSKSEKNQSPPQNKNIKEGNSVPTPPFVRNIANQISLLSDNVSKLQKQVSAIPANNNKTQTNCAKLKQIAQERDALQLTVKNLQKENSKLSSEVSELRAKNAPQAAEISVFKSNNPNSAGAVHIQMPPYFPYPAMFSPTLPLHTNQQQQSFAFSNPILNTACKHTNYGNWVWACHF